MAKSLRSKWRRKCRAVKRIRYGEKELARLKKTLGIDENSTKDDVEMKDIEEIATVTDAKAIKESAKDKENKADEDCEKMDDGTARVYNKKTLLDQYGNYPVWMNRRKIAKHKKGRAKTKKATTKTGKKVTRRERKAQASSVNATEAATTSV